MLIHDSSYVGENAWDDDPEPSKENVKQIIDSDARLNAEEKEELRKDLGISGQLICMHIHSHKSLNSSFVSLLSYKIVFALYFKLRILVYKFSSSLVHEY